jgi:hypothetical protein
MPGTASDLMIDDSGKSGLHARSVGIVPNGIFLRHGSGVRLDGKAGAMNAAG